MQAVDLSGVTSGGQWVDPTGLGTPEHLTYVPAGAMIDPTGVGALGPFDLTIPGLSLRSTSQLGFMNQAPEGTFYVDTAGNIVASDGSVVIPAGELGTALGGALDLGPLGVSAPTPTWLSPETGGAPVPPPPPPPPPEDKRTLLQRIGERFGLDTTTGKLLATLVLGAGGIGLAQLLAGDGASIQVPQPPQTAGQQALSDLFATNPAAAQALQDAILRSLQGDATAAEVLANQLTLMAQAQGVEAPWQAAIRQASLADLLAMQQGAEPLDPVAAALREQLLSISSTGTTNPALLRRFREQQDLLHNRMFRRAGPEWAMTTPGIDALTKLEESQGIQTYEDWLRTMGLLTGPYERAVMDAYNRSTGLSVLGLPNVPATTAALTSLANPMALGGVETTNAAALRGQASQDLAALYSALSEQQARAGLGRSVSDLVGLATRNAFGLAA